MLSARITIFLSRIRIVPTHLRQCHTPPVCAGEAEKATGLRGPTMNRLHVTRLTSDAISVEFKRFGDEMPFIWSQHFLARYACHYCTV